MDHQLELIEYRNGTNENVLKVQVAPHIAKRCREDPAYSRSLFNQIRKKNLDGVTSIKVTPVPIPLGEIKKNYWNEKEIHYFLKIYQKYILMHKSGTHDSKKWLAISAELAKKNIKKSPEKCRQKWKNLLRSYKNALNNHRLTTKFNYVQQMSSILHQDEASIDIPDASSSEDNDGGADSKIIQGGSDSFKREVWSKYEILKFLKEFQNVRNDQPHYVSKNQHWHILSKKLGEEGIFKSPEKLHIKWKNLYHSYRLLNLKNKVPVKFEFFNEVKSLIEGEELPEPDLTETANRRDLEFNYTSWSGEETLRLIEIYKRHKSLFSELPKKMAWKVVSADLQLEEIKKDADKCENKWKNLIRSYKRNKSYNSSARFYFFNEMKEILEAQDEECLDESESLHVVNDETEEEAMDSEEIENDKEMDSSEEIIIDTNIEHNYSWSKDEITVLITSYDQHSVNKKTSDTSFWKGISEDMGLNNFERNPEECQKMCETLLAEYEKHKHNNTRNSFPFFTDIDKILNKEKLENDVMHHDLCKCFGKKAMDKERRHTERMRILERKLDIEDRKVTAFEKYVQHLTEMSASASTVH